MALGCILNMTKNTIKTETMATQNTRILIILVSCVTLLLVPFIAMQFTHEVDWKISDFIVAGILLFGTGLMLELILRKIRAKKKRLLTSIILIILFLLIWAELAVGILGSPLSGN